MSTRVKVHFFGTYISNVQREDEVIIFTTFFLLPSLWHEQVPADRTELVPVSLDRGFELHHAEKSYIMLNM